MSETKTTRKQLPAYLILALIALAAALLLAVTNAIMRGPSRRMRKQRRTRRSRASWRRIPSAP